MYGIMFGALFWLVAVPQIELAFVLLTMSAVMTKLFTTWAGFTGHLADQI